MDVSWKLDSTSHVKIIANLLDTMLFVDSQKTFYSTAVFTRKGLGNRGFCCDSTSSTLTNLTGPTDRSLSVTILAFLTVTLLELSFLLVKLLSHRRRFRDPIEFQLNLTSRTCDNYYQPGGLLPETHHSILIHSNIEVPNQRWQI